MFPNRPENSPLEELRAEQSARWQNNEPVLVEQLLAENPDSSLDEEALLELICAELMLREEAGETPSPSEYAARFPQLGQAVTRQVTAHLLLATLSEPSAGADVKGTAPAIASLDRTNPDATIPIGPQTAAINKAQSGDVPTADRAQAFWPQIPGYDILGELGRGGMGVVYLAMHRDLKRKVALKMIRESALADQIALVRFRVEAQAVARLTHPNIVQIYDFGEHNGLLYFSLEYLPEGGLDRHIQQEPPGVRESAALVATLARAIDFAHQQGIIHRDLKPANILLASTVNRNQEDSNASPDQPTKLAELTPRIADFGLAKSLVDDQNLTGAEGMVGTPAYMSPEQAWGGSRTIGPAVDIHALGLILYELLTGVTPFRDASFARVLDKIRFDEIPAASQGRPEIPPELDTICRRCLQKEPGDRYPTAAAMADDLERYLQGQPVEPVPQQKRPRRRSPWIARLSLVLLLFAGTAGYYLFRDRNVKPLATGTSDLTADSTPVLRTQGERFAFLSGVRSYRFPEGTVELDYTEADVDEMSRVLFKRGFARKNIHLLTQWSEADNPQLAPTGPNLRDQLAQILAGCIEEDEVVIVLTGMGSSSQGMYCYLPADAQPGQPGTLISLNDLYDLLGDCPARLKLLLVDTCQTAGSSATWPQVKDPPPGVAAMFACSPQETSWELPSLRHGVFSYHVMRALEGAGDANGDHKLSLEELFQYARSGVADTLAKEAPGAIQTPQLFTKLPGDTKVVSLDSQP
ncbi:protein kinase domain-containing protein [Lignipirellula cremea]|uniref:Serine/threonine-protein kinase PknB n=1 Tax=Lignipirellula cremea TaxID=2528010 RepID=A0A518DWE9_9BACT|nr:protein kinase [Lignipirellula cremea]QDU96153.1 Serine/threonine-protein kinase PknB [Lignipirellula cremea]